MKWTLGLCHCSAYITSRSRHQNLCITFIPPSFPATSYHSIKVGQIMCIACIFTRALCVTSSPAIQELATPMTSATMELYDRIVRDLPPTPSKFHYIFNLRDLSRIYHGLYLTVPERFSDPANFVRVWRNECMRVFYDRLTNDKDRTLVLEHMRELLEQYFKPHSEVKEEGGDGHNTRIILVSFPLGGSARALALWRFQNSPVP